MASHLEYQSSRLCEPFPLPPHLKKVLEDTGRRKFSSATPTPQSQSADVLSPKPNRAFRRHLEKINRASFMSDRSVGSGKRSGSSPPPHIAQPPRRTPQDTVRSSNSNFGPSPGSSFTRASSASSNAITLRDPSRNSSRNAINIEPQIPSIARITREFHSRIEVLLNKIRNSDGVSTDMQADLVEHVQSIAQEFNQQHRRLQDAFDRVTREKNQNQSTTDLMQTRADLETATIERDFAFQEREAHRRIAEKLQSRATNEAQRVAQMQTSWKEVHESLLHQLAIQDEQLKGRRALWLEANPGSSARRDAMNAIRDPFNSPTTGAKAGFDRGLMGTMMIPPAITPLGASFQLAQHSQAQYGPPPSFSASQSGRGQFDTLALRPASQRSLRKRPNLPTQKALASMNLSSYVESQHKVFNTEPGSRAGHNDPPMRLPSIRADLADMDDDVLAEYYQDEFARLFAMTEGWVKSYCSKPNMGNDRKIAQSGQELWQYMMNCAYPGQLQDSHTHVIALLNDARSRCWFVMRMIIGFCVKDILSLDIFNSFGAKQEAALHIVKTKLLERGLNTEARQKLMDEQALVIEEILHSDGCTTWRNNVMNHVSKRMRDMVGPLLNDGGNRTKAGADLGAIGMFAWKLSADIHTSHLTFQIFFPETASKFNASTMVAKDQTRVSPLELQIKQVRLKLVVTPVVTLRDDRTTTIKAKSLHHATVLIMS